MDRHIVTAYLTVSKSRWRRNGLTHQLIYRNFGRRKKPNRRAPSTGAPAHVQSRSVAEVIVAGIQGISEKRQKREGEYLTLMGVSGNLKVKEAEGCGIDNRLVLEEQCKLVPRDLLQKRALYNCLLQPQTHSGSVIDADDVNGAVSHSLVPKDSESSFPREFDRPLYARVVFVVTCNCVFPVFGLNFTHKLGKPCQMIDLRINEVAGGNKNIGLCSLDGFDHFFKSATADDQTEVDIGYLHNCEPVDPCWQFCGLYSDPL